MLRLVCHECGEVLECHDWSHDGIHAIAYGLWRVDGHMDWLRCAEADGAFAAFCPAHHDEGRAFWQYHHLRATIKPLDGGEGL